MRIRALAAAILLLLAGSAALPQTPHGTAPVASGSSGFGQGSLANQLFQQDLRGRRSEPAGGGPWLTTVLRALVRFTGLLRQPLAFIIDPIFGLSRAGDRVDVDPQSQPHVAMHKNKREPP